MLEDLASVASHQLDGDDYVDDFWPRFQQAKGVCWKLERLPHFESPDVPSWVAMTSGDWEAALEMMDGPMRKAVQEDFVQFPNLERRRVRIVERPLTPYLQWELNVFRVRSGEGERIKVLDASAVRHLETSRLLPEVIALGDEVLYEVLYSDKGDYLAARRIDDPARGAAQDGDGRRGLSPLLVAFFDSDDPDGQRAQMYTNMIFSHWELMFELDAMTERHLREAAAIVLSGDEGNRFWEGSRVMRLNAAGTRREHRFHQIIDDEFHKLHADPPDPSPGEAAGG